MDFSATIEFLRDCTVHQSPDLYTKDIYSDNWFRVFDGYSGPLRGVPSFNRRTGQIETITGRLTFEATERGWRGSDGQVH
jgi:hypothetical protein